MTAGLVAVVLIAGCGISKSSAPKDSGHTIRDQCNRTLNFFANDLGIADVAIEYGSDKPEGSIAQGATCTITQASLVGVGQTRLRAMLPSETDPPLLKGDPSYIPQSGYEEKVWLNRTDDAVRIATKVDGWQGTLTVNTALIKTKSGNSEFKISDQQIRSAAQFLIDLTSELGS
ncbi:hypothetical protein [Nocardia abscessus]|uniref:hypothetical protein n=1 Tax=Nocardia abscessus TaxID=120957 RepID=UPI002453BE0B|nr:hypothetical protein [Nocardia abscessus]